MLKRICVVSLDVAATDGAGISRILNGRHDVLSATDSWSGEVESLQVDYAEGPCVDAVRSVRPQLEPDMASDAAHERWPRFSSAARKRGVAAAFAFPLIADGVAIGALDLYAVTPRRLAGEEFEDALLLADLAGLAVSRAGEATTVAGVELSAEPLEEWAYAGVVHNATGMISEQLGISIDDALLRLRAVAFATERSVDDVARDVVARTVRIDPWTDHG